MTENDSPTAEHFPISPRRRSRERGVAILIAGFMLFLTVGTVGLAIDGGLAYLVKGRLMASVDSAALGAARGLNLGGDQAAANAYATSNATRFFNANFPAGYLGSTPSQTTVNPTFSILTTNGVPNGVLQVDVAGAVTAPTYFMKIFNVPSVRVSATGTATRRTLVMMMILDVSGSMGSRNTSVGTIPATLVANASSCEAMVYSSIKFLDYFSSYDYIGVTTFSAQAQTVFAPSNTYKASGTGAANAIANLQCGGSTNTTPGLELAYTGITNVGLKLAINEIVLFTDGVANTVTGNFPLRTQKDTRFTPSPVNLTVGTAPTTNTLLMYSDPANPLTFNPGTGPGWPKTLPLSNADYNDYFNANKTSGASYSTNFPNAAVMKNLGWYLPSKSGPYQKRFNQDTNAPTNNFVNCLNNTATNYLASKCYNMAVATTGML